MDYNWLLSTSAQSAAAIVAIVAGFVLSRVLALSAERSGLESRIRKAKRNLAFHLHEAEECEAERFELEVEAFLKRSRDRMIESRGKIDLEELIIDDPSDLTKDELLPFFESESSTIKRAFNFFKSHSFKSPSPQTADEFFEGSREVIPQADRAIYRDVYRELTRQNRETQSGLANASVVSNGNMLDDLPSDITVLRANRYQDLLKIRDDHKANVRLLEKQVDELMEMLSNLGRPKDLGVGVVALLYFSLSGIVLPILLLPTNAATFSSLDRWVIVGGFISGLFFVLGYLVWSVKHLG